MKVLVGAEDIGAINLLEFNVSTPEDLYPTKPTTITFAAEGRSSYVQKVIVCKLESGKEYITVARKGGVIQMYDLDSLKLEKEWKGASKSPTDPIVGLEFANDKLYSCSSQGRVIVRDLKDEDSEFSYWHTTVKEPISAFRIHPNQPDIVSSGGKDKDLEVMQLFSSTLTDSRFGMVRANWFLQALQSEEMGQQRLRTKWQARNPRQDEYGFRCPVWISDIQFLDTNRPQRRGWRLVVSTRYGHINIYETKVSRKPILSVLVSYHPLVNLWFGGNEHELLYTDTQNNVGVFDSVTGKVLKMKGEAGTSMLHIHAAYKDGKTDFEEVEEDRIGQQATTLSQMDDDDDDDDNKDADASIDSSTQSDSQTSTTTQGIIQSRSPSPSPSQATQSSSSSPQSVSRPILACGGLDTYLRIYDLHRAQMVSKINTNTKISQVWIVDASPMPSDTHTEEVISRRRRRSSTEEVVSDTQLPSLPSDDDEHDNKRQRRSDDNDTHSNTYNNDISMA